MKPDLRVLFPVFLPGTGVWTGRQGGLGLSRPQRWASRRKRTSSPFSPLQGRAVRMWQGARLSHRPRIAGHQEQDHITHLLGTPESLEEPAEFGRVTLMSIITWQAWSTLQMRSLNVTGGCGSRGLLWGILITKPQACSCRGGRGSPRAVGKPAPGLTQPA